MDNTLLVKSEYKKLGKIIQQLRGDLCYGIQMTNIMYKLLFEKLGGYYTKDDILKEHHLLDILKNETRITEWHYNKEINYILKRKIIKINGIWSPLSKYDTNYSVHSLILGDLILKAKNDEDCPFDIDFNGIYNEIRNLTPYYWGKTEKELYETNQTLMDNLSKIKDEENSLKDIINYYFPSIKDFEKYSWKVWETTGKGDKVEEEFSKRIVKYGFNIVSRGFNGSFIDIAFGVDFIIEKINSGKKYTVQVKKSKPNKEDMDKYFDEKFIDIIAWEDGGKIIMKHWERKEKVI